MRHEDDFVLVRLVFGWDKNSMQMLIFINQDLVDLELQIEVCEDVEFCLMCIRGVVMFENVLQFYVARFVVMVMSGMDAGGIHEKNVLFRLVMCFAIGWLRCYSMICMFVICKLIIIIV